MSVTPSQFAIFRLVTVMLSVDGPVKANELRWFKWLLRLQGLSTEQVQQLKEDLKNPPLVHEVMQQVVGIDDRLQLRGWLQRAMNKDRIHSAREIALYDRILKIDRDGPAIEATWVGLNKEFSDIKEHTKFWKNMKKYGDRLSTRVDRNPFWLGWPFWPWF